MSIHRTHITNPENRHKIIQSPSELFTKDGKPVKNVFMLGQPGHGKTIFCLHLLKIWCAAKTNTEESRVSWQDGMMVFDFVFYVSLRHVDRSRSSVVEMICEDVFERDDVNKDVISHVLGSSDYRCLVLVDGLDEWVLSPDVQDKLRQKGLPNTTGLSKNCTMLFASRHWKMEILQTKYSRNDKVVEIMGLSERGIDKLIENILVNFFNKVVDSPSFKEQFTEIKKNIKQSQKFLSSRKIPVLVTTAIYSGNYVQDSATCLILEQLELLIKRAVEGGLVKNDVKDKFSIAQESEIDVPEIIQQKKIVLQLIVVLFKLGKIAFNGLIQKTSHLVFNSETLVESLGERELDIALKVGIISKMRAPGRFHIPKVSIEFLHKSIQEALAALYIVCDKSNAIASLGEYCCTLDKIFEVSNVLQYMAGINPVIGSQFSHHIMLVASKDHDIIKDRDEIDLLFNLRARMLHNIQRECYKEIHTLSITKDCDPSPLYHVTDIVLHFDDDNDKVRITCDLMRGCPGSILSFSMLVWGKTPWLPGTVLQLLPQCSNLTTLHVVYDYTTPDPELVSVIPTLTHLERVGYRHNLGAGEERDDVDSRVIYAILQLPHLKHVRLECVKLDDNTLVLTNTFTHLQIIELYNLSMSPEGWKRFSTGLLSGKHSMDVRINRCNIDNDTRDRILESKYITLTVK